MDPRVAASRGLDDLGERVEGAAVDVARLRADDRRPVADGQRALERVGAHPALVVGVDHGDAGAAEAEQPQRPRDGDVRLRAGQDLHRRRAEQALLGDVPARAREHRVAGGGQAGDVGHLRAGDEADARARGQAEEVEQPLAGDRLDGARGGRGDGAEAVLVPRRGQPVGGQRGGQRAAGDEAEVAPAGRRRETRLDGRGELVDHGLRRDAVLGQRRGQRGAQLADGGLRACVALADRGQVSGGEIGGVVQERGIEGSHPSTLPRPRSRSQRRSGHSAKPVHALGSRPTPGRSCQSSRVAPTASAPPKPTSPTPANVSAMRIARGPTARRATAVPLASKVTHVRLPSATPATSSAAPAELSAAPATLAAAKIAAHEAIVDGFEAVPASAVRNARRGVATSASASPPWRTRNALHSVRAPSTTSTAAPTRPSPVRTGSKVSSGAAPAAPAAA